MLPRVCALGVIAALIGGARLDACGDKFVNIGRSPRFQGYQAIHPASILIYRSPKATDKGIKEFESLLKTAGHEAVVLKTGASVAQAVTAAHYDIIIADYADATRIRTELQSTSMGPRILPVLNKPSKQLESQADLAYSCLIKPEVMDRYDALAEIDRVMTLRSNDKTVQASH